MNLLTRISNDVLNLIYPSLCEACGSELVATESCICTSCWMSFPQTNFHLHEGNPVELRFAGRFHLQHAASFYYFNKDSRIQDALHSLKYRRKVNVGIELGKRYAHVLPESKWIHDVDVMIPIPLAEKKLLVRGYNQAELITQGIHQVIPIPMDTQSLIRKKNTLSQTRMHVSERIENMKDAFEVLNPSSLTNKHVLLVDDVITTGSTFESCARELLKLNNTRVSILSIAYAIE